MVFLTTFIAARSRIGLLLTRINRWFNTDYRDSLLNLLILRVIMIFRYQLGCAFVSWKLLHDRNSIRHCMPRRLFWTCYIL